METCKKRGGVLILSGRFTNRESLSDKRVSYQLLDCKSGESATYMVMNFMEWIDKICMMKNLHRVEGYGYYGKPSTTARTLYEEVCFGTMALYKGLEESQTVRMKLDVPMKLFSSIV